MNFRVLGFKSFGYHKETTGTPITESIPCDNDGSIAIVQGSVTPGSLAETISFMYAKGTGSRNHAASDAATAQKVLNVVDAPKDPAGNAAASGDVIAYLTEDLTWEFNTVASVTSNAITLTNNIAKKVLAGAKVNIIGAVGDGAEFHVPVVAATTKEFGNGNVYLVHPFRSEPMYLHITNHGTGDASLNNLLIAYINK